jgi:hypothetical protein
MDRKDSATAICQTACRTVPDASGSTGTNMTKRTMGALVAALIAALGWAALIIDFARSLQASLAKGESVLEALYLHFRYFTITTNVGIAVLMTMTAGRLARGTRLPPAAIYNAGVVYGLVTCVAYELLLRGQWSPHGIQFVTDLMLHDVVPPALLAFWIGFAPRGGQWREAAWMLAYPTIYFSITLIAGALGANYPYDFLDVSKLGYPAVFAVAAAFLAIFYVLASTATALSRRWNARDDRSPEV